MNDNILDEAARDLVQRPHDPEFADVLQAISGPDLDQLAAAWFDEKMRENDDRAHWITSDLMDAIDVNDDGSLDRSGRRSRILFESLIRGQRASASEILMRALRILVARRVQTRVTASRFTQSLLAPLRAALDRYDEITADRRALADQHNRSRE